MYVLVSSHPRADTFPPPYALAKGIHDSHQKNKKINKITETLLGHTFLTSSLLGVTYTSPAGFPWLEDALLTTDTQPPLPATARNSPYISRHFF